MNETYLFLDCETTDTQPYNGEMISIALIATDEHYNEYGRFYEECSLEGDRIITDVFGREKNLWPDPTYSTDPRIKNATDIHGITWATARKSQKPVEMYRKMWSFLQSIPQDTNLRLIQHSESKFDIRWLLYRSNLHAEPLYKHLIKRISTFEYREAGEDGEKGGEYTNGWRFDDTMSMARKYIKNGKNTLAKATKIQKRTDKINDMLTKDRKTPLKQSKIDEYNDEKASLAVDMELLNTSEVTLTGWSLDKICKSLNIKLDHHNAESDTAVLIPIYKFLKQSL